MKKVTLRFSTIIDMLDFETTIVTYGHHKDHSLLTISGYFQEADIELAKAGYKATITEDPAE